MGLEKGYPLTINGIYDPWPGSERKWAQTTVGIWLCQRYLKQSVSPRFQPLGFIAWNQQLKNLTPKKLPLVRFLCASIHVSASTSCPTFNLCNVECYLPSSMRDESPTLPKSSSEAKKHIGLNEHPLFNRISLTWRFPVFCLSPAPVQRDSSTAPFRTQHLSYVPNVWSLIIFLID